MVFLFLDILVKYMCLSANSYTIRELSNRKGTKVHLRPLGHSYLYRILLRHHDAWQPPNNQLKLSL